MGIRGYNDSTFPSRYQNHVVIDLGEVALFVCVELPSGPWTQLFSLNCLVAHGHKYLVNNLFCIH